MQGDIGQKVNGRLKYIEPVTGSNVVKAVGGVAAIHIAFKRLAFGVKPPLMGMARDAVFIESDEYGVVVFLFLSLDFSQLS
jgi:hypothetical protein